LIGDVRDAARLNRAVCGADIVIHAAALKRLDILEYNVAEAIKTNVLGTLNVIDACLESDVKKAVFISTDKACSPVNTYGACKFVGERIFTESNYNKGRAPTIFTCVRYGNVLESTGSVIPFFVSKISDNQKVPVTDERMTRFIISPTQAVELVFNALKFATGGEVFVPRLPAFKILDLIDVLKEKCKRNVETEVIGIRPGEKIHELMINSSEVPRTYELDNLYVITSVIEEYVSAGSEKAEYIKRGRKLSEKDMTEFCSKDAVITKEELKCLFKELGLL
jgi:FlaA1/EpsC-like NDP-sugar epimerase